MKALVLAASFVVLLVAALLFWATTHGSALDGEPVAILQIKSGQGVGTADRFAVEQRGERQHSGQSEVVLNVSLRGSPQGTVGNRTGGQNSGLLEKSKYGLLPKRADDGRTPASAYASRQAGHRDGLPRISILLTGLGLDQALSQDAIRKMPPEVSLAFSAYGRKLAQLTRQAQRFGHEYLLQVPMQPVDPLSDSGPQSLQAFASAAINQSRLHWSLGRLTGYFGVVNYRGGRYLRDKDAVKSLFGELQQRGLVFFHDEAGGDPSLAGLAGQTGLGYSRATLSIDRIPTREGILKALKKLEASAKRLGFAVGVIHMHRVSIDMINAWAKSLKQKQIGLVPLSQAYRFKELKQARNGI